MDREGVLQDCSVAQRPAPMARVLEIHIFVRAQGKENIRANRARSFREGHTVSLVRNHRRDKARRDPKHWNTARSLRRLRHNWLQADMLCSMTACTKDYR